MYTEKKLVPRSGWFPLFSLLLKMIGLIAALIWLINSEPQMNNYLFCGLLIAVLVALLVVAVCLAGFIAVAPNESRVLLQVP